MKDSYACTKCGNDIPETMLTQFMKDNAFACVCKRCKNKNIRRKQAAKLGKLPPEDKVANN